MNVIDEIIEKLEIDNSDEENNVKSNIEYILNIIEDNIKIAGNNISLISEKILNRHSLIYENLNQEEMFNQTYYLCNDDWEYDYSTKVINNAKISLQTEKEIITYKLKNII